MAWASARSLGLLWMIGGLCSLLSAGCVDEEVSGPDLEVQIFTSSSPNLNPIPAGMPSIRFTARDAVSGRVLKTRTFDLSESGAKFSGIPFNDQIQIVVEGLDVGGVPIYRGMSTPFAFKPSSNDRRVPVLFTALESFSEATTLTVGVDRQPVVQPVRFAVGLTRAGHVQTPLPGGRVLFTGGGVLEEGAGLSSPFLPDGLGLRETIAAVEVYDPASGTFFALPNMLTPRAFHTTTQLADGRVLVVGGVTVIETGDGPVIESVRPSEIFDPASQRWSQITGEGGLGTGRAWHTATLRRIDGKVVVIGGRNITRGVATLVGDAEVFNPQTNRFERNAGDAPIVMVAARAEHTAVLMRSGLGVGADILVIGGEGAEGPVASMEMLRGVNNNALFEFSDSVGAMVVPRSGHSSLAASPEQGNLIVTVGGVDAEGQAVSGVEIFDVAANVAVEAGNLAIGRSRAQALELPMTEKIVIFGGLDSGGRVIGGGESLIFNSTNGRYTSLPVVSAMVTPRFMHEATLLSNGLVLLTGGVGEDGGEVKSLNKVEIFNPDDGSPLPLVLAP